MRPRCRGFALVTVLWVGVALAAIAASFALEARSDTRAAAGLVDRSRGEALAAAGVHRGILALLTPDPDAEWTVDGTARVLRFANGVVHVALHGEGGRIDLNAAAPELLEQMLRNAAAEIGTEADSGAALDALLDWRDPDASRRGRGAEDRDYAPDGYGSRDGPLLGLEELTQIRGFDHALAARVAAVATVHSGQPQIDPMSASRAVLLAVPGLTHAAVDAFLEARAAGGGDAALAGLAAGGAYLAAGASRVFSVVATARTGAGTVLARRAVVRLTGRQEPAYQIIEWRDGSTTDDASAGGAG